jgi:hypothetical protein
MRKIWSPHHQLYLPLGGRLIPKVRPKLRLANYIKDVAPSELPTPPDACSYADKAPNALRQMYLNDKYGCCVVAALAHARGVTHANAGLGELLYSDDDIRSMYHDFSGDVFNPNDPSNTDEGCDEGVALSVATDKGFTDGVKLSGHIGIDGANWNEFKLAVYLFECPMSGQGIPEAWVQPFPAPGATWDVAGPAVPTNGHAVAYPGYTADEKALTVTWGMQIWETREALAAYASPAGGGELWAFLTPDIISRASQKAPTGFDFDALRADLAALPAV